MGDSAILTIVIVEDSVYFADLTMRILKRSGLIAKFRVVSTRVALRAALNEERCDIILSDNIMPGFNALDALEVKNEVCCNTPFIIVSEDISQKELKEAFQRGCNSFLTKDRIAELPDLINKVLFKVES